MSKLITTLLLALMVVSSGAVFADDDARDYIAAPSGTKAFMVYARHISGNQVYVDGDKVADNTNLSMNLGIARPIYYTEIGGVTAIFQALIPFADATLDGSDLGGASFLGSGLGDPIVSGGAWLVNNAEARTWLAAAVYVTVPVGQYDNETVLNIGGNRWAFKPEIGLAKGLGTSKFHFDLIGNVEVYSNNTEYGAASVTLEQDPLITLESHLSYDLSKSVFASVDYWGHFGGETTVDEIAQDDAQSNHSIGAAVAFGFAPGYQLLAQYNGLVGVDNGSKTNTFGLRFAHFWN